MSTSLKPKVRPTDLPRLEDYPKESPVAPPTDVSSDEPIFEWCEELRDHYQKAGQRLSAVGLLRIADVSGLESADIKALRAGIKRIYASEFAVKKPAKASGKKPAAKPTKPATKPAKASGKKPAAKPAAPSRNGHGGESKVVYTATVRGIPVEVRKTPEGKFMVSLFDYPIRKVMQWMGASKWVHAEALEACTSLLSKCAVIGANIAGKWIKGGESYVRATLNEGHIGSGRNAGFKGKGVFGKVPQLSKDEARALNALR